MAIRTEKLGGTDWVDGNVLTAEDLVDTIDANTKVAVYGTAQIPYTTLKSTGTWTNEGFLFADRAVLSNWLNKGVLLSNTGLSGPKFNPVDLSYELGVLSDVDNGTNHTLNSWTDVSNAFDKDLNTYAQASGNDNEKAIGKTFSSRFIRQFRVGFTLTPVSFRTYSVKVQTYNGSTWEDFETVMACPMGGSVSTIQLYDITIPINKECQGIRVLSWRSSGSSPSGGHTFRVYYLDYGYLFETNVNKELKITPNLTNPENIIILNNDFDKNNEKLDLKIYECDKLSNNRIPVTLSNFTTNQNLGIVIKPKEDLYLIALDIEYGDYPPGQFVIRDSSATIIAQGSVTSKRIYLEEYNILLLEGENYDIYFGHLAPTISNFLSSASLDMPVDLNNIELVSNFNGSANTVYCVENIITRKTNDYNELIDLSVEEFNFIPLSISNKDKIFVFGYNFESSNNVKTPKVKGFGGYKV